MDNRIDKIVEDGVISRWKPAAVLRVSGDDAAPFLQGQFTNDLRNLRIGDAVYGLWLDHRGKVLADSFVVGCSGGEFLLVSYFSAAKKIRERLERFVIADDVVIVDETERWSARSIFGPGPRIPGEVDAQQLWLAGRRSNRPNFEWLYGASPENELAVNTALAGRRELSAREIELERICAGVPAVPVDIGPGELPPEGGMETAAISYTKGCYVGQEVIARLRTMGQVRRRLMRVQAERTGVPVTLPAALYDGDRRVGELRSAVAHDNGFVGLALLTLLHLKADARLSLSAGGEPRTVTLIDQR